MPLDEVSSAIGRVTRAEIIIQMFCFTSLNKQVFSHECRRLFKSTDQAIRFAKHVKVILNTFGNWKKYLSNQLETVLNKFLI